MIVFKLFNIFFLILKHYLALQSVQFHFTTTPSFPSNHNPKCRTIDQMFQFIVRHVSWCLLLDTMTWPRTHLKYLGERIISVFNHKTIHTSTNPYYCAISGSSSLRELHRKLSVCFWLLAATEVLFNLVPVENRELLHKHHMSLCLTLGLCCMSSVQYEASRCCCMAQLAVKMGLVRFQPRFCPTKFHFPFKTLSICFFPREIFKNGVKWIPCIYVSGNEESSL